MPAVDYQRIREIGSGSFGRALLVQAVGAWRQNQVEKKLLVIKEIDLSSRDVQQRASAEMEVRVMTALKHPYIVRYWESFVEGHQLCIVMDYCECGDLWQHIARCRRIRQPICEAQVVRWLTQMALALKYMHEKSVLHRDIKTQNVLLAKKAGSDLPSAKIADFGIAKVLSSAHGFAHTLVGTPYYLSPEICQRQLYGCPSDVWAVGCVLYEMCALRVPFDGQDCKELVERILRGPLPRIPSTYSGPLCDASAELFTRDVAHRPTAASILQRPLFQNEIKRMLAEQHKAGRAPAPGALEHVQCCARPELIAPRTGRDGSKSDAAAGRSRGERPSGLSREPSARSRHRSASPAKGVALEVLRPRVASASPTPRLPPRASHGGC